MGDKIDAHSFNAAFSVWKDKGMQIIMMHAERTTSEEQRAFSSSSAASAQVTRRAQNLRKLPLLCADRRGADYKKIQTTSI
jgi:hypothetical protein